MNQLTRIRWMMIVWAVADIALFATTHRLWTGDSSFPKVPLLSLGYGLGSFPNTTVLAVLIVTSAAALLFSIRDMVSNRSDRAVSYVTRSLIALHCALLIATFIANQHCLQPWAYLAVILGGVLVFADARSALRLIRITAVAVYLYSAISKFDHQFVATLGQRFLYASLGLFGQSAEAWSPTWQSAAILVFPAVELFVALGLLWSSTRRAAVWLAVAMHLGLIVVLGSVYLEQQPAVRIWNSFFLVQALLLFGWNDSSKAVEDDAMSSQTNRFSNLLATAIVGFAVLFPLLEPFGYCDHWPSWGLYAPRNSRVIVFVEEGAVARLPQECRDALVPAKFEDPDFASPAYRLSLNHWSLVDLHVPAYPQDRFQVAVALAIADHYELGDQIHVELQGKSNRFTGDRTKTMIDGVEELREVAGDFRLNAK